MAQAIWKGTLGFGLVSMGVPEEFTDTYRRDVLKLIKARARGGVKRARTDEEPESEARVLDLMEALRQSVAKKTARSSKTRRTRKSA